MVLMDRIKYFIPTIVRINDSNSNQNSELSDLLNHKRAKYKHIKSTMFSHDHIHNNTIVGYVNVISNSYGGNLKCLKIH